MYLYSRIWKCLFGNFAEHSRMCVCVCVCVYMYVVYVCVFRPPLSRLLALLALGRPLGTHGRRGEGLAGALPEDKGGPHVVVERAVPRGSLRVGVDEPRTGPRADDLHLRRP